MNVVLCLLQALIRRMWFEMRLPALTRKAQDTYMRTGEWHTSSMRDNISCVCQPLPSPTCAQYSLRELLTTMGDRFTDAEVGTSVGWQCIVSVSRVAYWYWWTGSITRVRCGSRLYACCLPCWVVGGWEFRYTFLCSVGHVGMQYVS